VGVQITSHFTTNNERSRAQISKGQTTLCVSQSSAGPSPELKYLEAWRGPSQRLSATVSSQGDSVDIDQMDGILVDASVSWESTPADGSSNVSSSISKN
jgi:hypothetical protein